MAISAEHWEGVYTRKKTDEVSWFRPHLEQSLAFIEEAALPKHAGIIDVGGGASTLVDDLLDRGYTNLAVLDLSAKALEVAQRRLGDRAARVQWLVGDVTTLELEAQRWAFWHDRAVFHFLREQAERERYVEQVRRALAPGGHIVVATFGPNGPLRCSDLDVQRYSADGVHAEFGGEFRKVGELTELHQTPSGKQQEFVYCYCRLGA
ncbi:MAG: class I SAM-dependent methyltransferase [Myxococcota bacterium]